MSWMVEGSVWGQGMALLRDRYKWLTPQHVGDIDRIAELKVVCTYCVPCLVYPFPVLAWAIGRWGWCADGRWCWAHDQVASRKMVMGGVNAYVVAPSLTRAQATFYGQRVSER